MFHDVQDIAMDMLRGRPRLTTIVYPRSKERGPPFARALPIENQHWYSVKRARSPSSHKVECEIEVGSSWSRNQPS